MKRTFEITLEGKATIEIDDAVLDQVDDDWRKNFYNLQGAPEIAAHIAFNVIVNRYRLTQLDGFADLKDSMVHVIEDEWETTSTPAITAR